MTPELATSVLISATCFFLVVYNRTQGGFLRALFRPEVSSLAMLIAVFTVRPLFTMHDVMTSFHGLSVTASEKIGALHVGSLAIVAMTTGVIVGRARTRDRGHSHRPNRPAPAFAGGELRSISVLVISLFSCLIYFVVLASLLGFTAVRELTRGRSSTFDLAVPEILTVLPLAGSIACAIYLIQQPQRLSRSTVLILAAAIMTSVASLSLLGTRRFLLPAVLIPLLAAVYSRPIRLKAWHGLGATVALLFLILIPATRSAGARHGSENLVAATLRVARESDPGELIRTLFTSYDTEMFDFVAYMKPRMGLSIPWGNGRGTLLEFLTRPLPASMGPKGFSDQLLSRLFGGQGCGQAACPVASLPGVAYFDFGYLGVFMLLFAFGILCARTSARLAKLPLQPSFSTLGAVVFSSYALVLVRTNSIIASWWVIYTLMLTAGLLTILRALPVRRSVEPQEKEPSIHLGYRGSSFPHK